MFSECGCYPGVVKLEYKEEWFIPLGLGADFGFLLGREESSVFIFLFSTVGWAKALFLKSSLSLSSAGSITVIWKTESITINKWTDLQSTVIWPGLRMGMLD